MPELIEVERYRLLAEAVLGRTVASVDAGDPWYLKAGATEDGLRAALVGRRVGAVSRIGKLLLLDTDGGPTLGLRFGMTGTLLVDGAPGVDRLLHASRDHDARWHRFALGFAGGGSLVVHDPRRLGGVALDPDTGGLGPDALDVTAAELSRGLRASTAPLKARLLDQAVVAGLGNLITDEVLWRAGLSPLREAASLSPAEVRRLHRHLGRSLADLTARGGSHLGDLMGERHAGGRCPKDGAELRRSTVGGRTSWWCPVHQA